MRRITFIFLLALITNSCKEDETPPPTNAMYFPPAASGNWETVSPESLGWNTSAIPGLITLLEDNNSRAFLVIKDGKIVIEEYMGKQFDNVTDFSSSSNWYWASAGKTLACSLVGIAVSQGKIGLETKSSSYLGAGWTSLTSTQEDKITVRHQLTMTTGLDDNVVNPDCTDKTCLTYKADAGTRWAYHNAPYTLLDEVIVAATGKSLNNFVNDELKIKIGMDGQYLVTGDNNVYYSTARGMARFGLLLLNKGKWDNTQIIPEEFHSKMIASSQSINPSYGYLTWLNGKNTFMIPKSQTVFPGPLSPNAPTDMYAAMGKNGQLINVVPSQNLVVIRMGDVPEDALVPFLFQDQLWEKLKEVIK